MVPFHRNPLTKPQLALFRHAFSLKGTRIGGTAARIVLAVLTIALFASAADAQDMGGKGRRHNSPQNAEQQKADPQKKKAIDDAYKTALERIPSPKDRYDPWRNAR